MTNVTVLSTPARWPRLLLPDSPLAKPADLEAAVKAGAWAAFTKAVEEMGAAATIAAVARSGLRGRGGSGFPTGEKWRACALAEADRRYVVVNAYQSDPAVFSDRVLLETNPYAVLEGAAIAAYAVGAGEIVVAVRAEATDAIRVMEAAIAAAEKRGFLGLEILGKSLEIVASVKPLQGSYMLGEETVLLKGIEGQRGQPDQQPPYPTTRGLYGLPTLIHHPQTFAAIPTIVGRAPGGYASIGSKASPGTALVQLSGSVARPGVAEVPMGTPLRDIVDLAGGVPSPHTLKALLVGGPSGGILPPDALGTGYEYDALEKAGAHIGSGSIVVVDERSCLVDLAAVLTRFCADEACGKTIPCRIGLRRMAEIGARFCDGRPRGDELTRLADLSADIVASGLCDHERRATLPLTSIARYFRGELDAHIVRNTCPAGVCQSL
ncbi:MAG TPA: NADH-ubiquinone oxidoreductase-F iron-sulfur binding region domain-containing protein, partial [Candidatus Limnocylindrales bacterium]